MIPQPDRRPSAGDDVEVAGSLIQHDRTVGAAHDDILDSRSVPPRNIDPGLDTERHPGGERFVIAGHEVWILVSLEADPVAGPVEEILAVSLGRNDPASSRIDRLAGDPWPDGRRCVLLGSSEDPEEVAEFLIRPLSGVAASHPQGPGDVAAVAAQCSADVQNDRLAGPDHAVRRLVM